MSILQIFYSPKKATKNVLDSTAFPWAVFAITLLTPLFTLLLNYDSMYKMLYDQLKTQFVTAGMDMTTTQLRTMTTTSMYITLGSSVVASGVMWLLFTLALMVLMGFFDNEYPFKRLFSMVGYTGLISVVFAIVTAVLTFVGISDVDFSLNTLIPAAKDNLVLSAVFSSFSIPRILRYILLFIGISNCLEKRSNVAIVTAVMFLLGAATLIIPILFLPAGSAQI